VTAEIDRRHALRSPRHRVGTGIRQPLEVEAPVPTEPRSEAGIEARAADLRVLFEEAASALLRETASPATGPACRWEAIMIRAHDLPGLAGLWLDRLIDLGASRLSDQRREAIVVVAVDRVASPDEDPQYGRWVLRARVGLRPYQEAAGASTREVRSASDRPLAVEQDAAGWRLRASLAF
jgi:hypothetical protein